MKSGAVIATLLALALITSPRAEAASKGTRFPAALAHFLRAFLAQRSETGVDPSTEVAVKNVDLGVSYRDAYVIYVRGGGWCGSGGCNTLIAARKGDTYKVLAFVPATELPIISLPSLHEGGRDVAVTLKGALDGDHFDAPTRAVLSLTGARYNFRRPIAATSPSGVGEVLIPAEATSTPLYGGSSR